MKMAYSISITPPGTTQYPLHQHNFYEIMLYLEGTGTLRTESGDYPFSPGTAIIVPKHFRHGSAAQNGFRNISVGGAFGSLLFSDAPVVIPASQDALLLGRLVYENRFSNAEYLESLIHCYTIALMQSHQSASSPERAVQKMVADIAANALHIDFSLAHILRSSGYAEDYIRSKFKAVTHSTPIEFLTHIRIEHACRLMNIYGSEMNITEIATQSGYSNSAYFSRVFKNVMGCSPLQYKKQHGASTSNMMR